jgi:hypothetical protein
VFQVKVNSARPDFRVFIDLLYSPSRDVDTSGNCKYPADRTWTDLYIRDRESCRPPINIWVPEVHWGDDDSCIDYVFNIESQDTSSAEAAAIYLFDYCGESIAEDGTLLGEMERETLRERYAEWILRAKRSMHYTPPKGDA